MDPLDEVKSKVTTARELLADGKRQEAEKYFTEAEKLVEELLVQDPTNAQAHFISARLLEDRQRYDEAAIEYLKARDLAPQNETYKRAYELMLQKHPGAGATVSAPPTRPVTIPEPAESEPAAGSTRVQAGTSTEAQTTSSSQDAQAFRALGTYRLREGDLAGAEEAFEQALKISPDHVDARKELVFLLLNQKRYSEAEEHLVTLVGIDRQAAEDVFALNPSDANAELSWLRGSLYQRVGDSETAEVFFRDALELQSDRADWIRSYAELLNSLGRKADAIQRLHDALARNPGDPALNREYARYMAQEEWYDQAEKHLKKALTIDPYDPETLALHDEIQPALDRYRKAYAYMRLAEENAESGSSEEAAVLYQKGLDIDGNHLPALKSYAVFLEQRGRFDEAVRRWVKVLDRDPEEAQKHLKAILDAQGENSETLNGLARVFVQLGHLFEAEEYLKRSLAHTSNNPDAMRLLVDLLEKQDRRDEAESLLSANLALVSTDATLSLAYARLLGARGDYDNAKKYYRRAQQLAPADPEVIQATNQAKARIVQFEEASREMALGWLEVQNAKYAEAESHYQRALQIDGTHIPTLELYTQLLEAQGKILEAGLYMIRVARIAPDKAIAHYCNPLGQQPQSVESHTAYGQLLQSLGRTDEAIEKFGLALEQQPTYMPALTPYVNLLLQGDRLCEANQALERALNQSDTLAQAHWLYGMVWLRRHDYDKAKKHLERACRLVPDNPRFKETLDSNAEKFEQLLEAQLAWATAKPIADSDPAEAESLFKEAYEHCPDHVPTLLDYAAFLLKQRRAEDARFYVQQVTQLDPCNERATHILTELESAAVETSESQTKPLESSDSPEEEDDNG